MTFGLFFVAIVALAAAALFLVLLFAPCAAALFGRKETIRAVMQEVEPTNIGRS